MPYTISLTSRLSVELEQLARLARNLNCGEPPARPFTPDDSEWKDHMRTSVEGRAQFDRQWNTVCGLVQGDESYCLKTELTRGLYRWVRQDPGNAPGQILVTACEHTPERFADFIEELLDPVKLARRHRLVATFRNGFINPCYAKTNSEIHNLIDRRLADDPDAVEELADELAEVGGEYD